MRKYVVLLMVLLCVPSWAQIYPPPTKWSPKDIVNWGMPKIVTYNSPDDARADLFDASPGDLIIVASQPTGLATQTVWTIWRCNDGGWDWDPIAFDTSAISAGIISSNPTIQSHDATLATIPAALSLAAANMASATANIAGKANATGSAVVDFGAQSLNIHGQIAQFDGDAETNQPNWRRAFVWVSIADETLTWKNVATIEATALSAFVVEAKITVADNMPSAGGLVKRWGVRNTSISELASEAYCLSGNAGVMSGLVQLVASGTGYSLQAKEITGKASEYDVALSVEGTGIGTITQIVTGGGGVYP